MAHKHKVWIESLSAILRLPTWALVLLIGVGTYSLVIAARLIAGPAVALVELPGDVFFLLLIHVPLLIPSYVRGRIVSLEYYALSMVDDPPTDDKLGGLSRLAPVGLLTVALFLGLVLPYGATLSGSPTPQDVLALASIVLVVFVNSTTLWTLVYSLFAVYRMGKLPLRLRDFTLDKMLGLKPFASTCLRLTGVYYLWLVIVIAPDLASPGTHPLILAQDLGLLLLGIPLFLLPLVSLRAKLVGVRSEKLSWINQRLHTTMKKVESQISEDLPPGLQNELLSIDKIQREIQGIKSWPFDLALVAKLLTILLSVTAILLSGFIRKLLGF